MGIFDRKKFGEEYKIHLADTILDNLGTEKHSRDPESTFTRTEFRDVEYENYGLKIVRPDPRRELGSYIYIEFCGKRVYDKDVFISGLWEQILSEIHQSMDELLKSKEENKLLEKSKKILSDLCDINLKDRLKIGNDVIFEKTDDITEDNHYNGSIYRIIYNDQEVFKAFKKNMRNDEFFLYIPGEWEEEVRLHAKMDRFDNNMRQKQEINEYAKESIKILRKMREK